MGTGTLERTMETGADEPLDAAVRRAVACCREGAVEEAERILNAAWGRETERMALAGSEGR